MDLKTPESPTPPSKPTAPAPVEPSAVRQYARIAAAEMRRFGRAMTRENIIDFTKTLAWVIPLTILIWIYAEREQEVVTPDPIPISIEVKSTDPNRIATLLRPPEKVITCKLQGPRTALDHLQNTLTPSSPLIITFGDTTPLGETRVSTIQKIMNDPRLKGITVLNCSPDDLVISMDVLETREVPVEAPPDMRNLRSAVFSPPTVQVKGPRQVLNDLAANGHLAVIADLAGVPLEHPGQHAPRQVPLLPIDPSGQITCSTKTVLATLWTKEPDVSYTATGVAVLLLAPGTLMDRYHIDYDKTLPSLTVVGPPEQIDKIRRHDVYPFAALELSSDDLNNPKPIPLRILNLPEGVQVAPGQNLTESFTATQR